MLVPTSMPTKPFHWPARRRLPRSRGFSLIELMVTVAVLAILAGIGIPAFQTMILNNRMTSQSNAFLAALQLARAEAVKRGLRVSVCKSANGTACTTAGGWQQGWIVFVDGGTAGSVDGGDVVLQVFQALGGNSTLTGAANVANAVTFLSTGFTTLAASPTATTITLCPPSPAQVSGRVIQVTPSGRSSIAQAACS